MIAKLDVPVALGLGLVVALPVDEGVALALADPPELPVEDAAAVEEAAAEVEAELPMTLVALSVPQMYLALQLF